MTRQFILILLIFLAGICLGAVVWCCVAPSPDLAKIQWMPQWLGNWADANPTFRNFPAFGALALLILSLLAVCLNRCGTFVLAFFSAVFVSLLAIILECLQVLMPGRFFDPADIAWSIAGAFFWGLCAGSLFEDFQAFLDL